jgi:hypothetical protein
MPKHGKDKPTLCQTISLQKEREADGEGDTCSITCLAWSEDSIHHDNEALTSDISLMGEEDTEDSEDYQAAATTSTSSTRDIYQEKPLYLAGGYKSGKLSIWSWHAQKCLFFEDKILNVTSSPLTSLSWRLFKDPLTKKRMPILVVTSLVDGWFIVYPILNQNGTILTWQSIQPPQRSFPSHFLENSRNFVVTILWLHNRLILLALASGQLELWNLSVMIETPQAPQNATFDSDSDGEGGEEVESFKPSPRTVISATFDKYLSLGSLIDALSLSPVIPGLPFRYLASSYQNVLFYLLSFQPSLVFFCCRL